MLPVHRRLAAIALGLGLVALAEGALRVSPLRPPSRDEWNRQWGAISIEHYYAEAPAHFAHLGADADGEWCGPAPDLVKTGDPYVDMMEPARFRCTPAEGTLRIVVLGESSVQGFGLRPGQTMPDHLAAAIGTRARPVEVINAGVAGYNSIQIRRMLPEIWALSPDVVVLYAGHNDFTYYPVVEAALAARPELLVARSIGDHFALVRLGRVLLTRMGALPEPPPASPARQGPLPSPRRDGPAAFNQPAIPDPTTEAAFSTLSAAQAKAARNIRAIYATDVREMVEEARAHDAVFVLATPVCRPDGMMGRSIHGRWLDASDRARWDALWPAVFSQPVRDDDPRLAELLALDPGYADLRAVAGQAALRSGNRDGALVHFIAALDAMPPTRSDRAPWGFGDDVVALGASLGIPTLDLRPDIAATVTRPPPTSGELFLDVLHFSDAGAAFVAARIATFLDEQGLLPPAQ